MSFPLKTRKHRSSVVFSYVAYHSDWIDFFESLHKALKTKIASLIYKSASVSESSFWMPSFSNDALLSDDLGFLLCLVFTYFFFKFND